MPNIPDNVLDNIIKDAFATDAKEVKTPPTPDFRKIMEDISKADPFTAKKNDHQCVQTSVSNAKDATECMRIANNIRRDAIVVSPPGCVMVNANSHAMKTTEAKFSAPYRQDVNLNDGRTVATFWPAPGQTAADLAQNMTQFYNQQAAIDYCYGRGVDSIDTHGSTAVATGGVSSKNAPEITGVLADEFKNAITITSDGYHLHAFTKIDPVVAEQLSDMGYNKMGSASPFSPISDFRFNDAQEANRFLQDAEQLISQREAKLAAQEASRIQSSVEITPKAGITIVKAHDLSAADATKAVGALEATQHNPIVLNSVDGSHNNMNIMIDARSPLGQEMMRRHSDALVGSTNPNVATLHFNNANETVAFLNEANTVARDLEREEPNNEALDNEEVDIGDEP